MSVPTTTTPTLNTPRRPALDREAARALMTGEYQRVAGQLRSLPPADWDAPTCNPGWDVRAVAAHLLGMAAMAASIREQVRQMRAARRRGGEFIDALTAVQIEGYDGWAPERLVAEYERLAPRAVKGRMRAPGFVRRRTLSRQPIDPPRAYEDWTFAYLLEVILTRDPWLHRSDIARATGREMELDAEHDGVIVDDVVREWAGRHGRPCTLKLTGPLSRSYAFPAGVPVPDGPSYTLDAVEFCRILSGRGTGDGLLSTRVPF